MMLHDDEALRVAVQATEAWLDLLLMATSMALAPYEWGGHLIIVCTRVLREGQ